MPAASIVTADSITRIAGEAAGAVVVNASAWGWRALGLPRPPHDGPGYRSESSPSPGDAGLSPAVL
jgi:hypothetical protein